eukprot:TRINITY_DN3572_c0_g1_i1.p1 TRINITY_DN3572_c0_g1~~TRINITY_DN3572_c0_g1_i1.p1  ORF type:complete len:730 (+),score=190.06 TRINITY_DN3572_c0_g1_i1:105-2294(+)
MARLFSLIVITVLLSFVLLSSEASRKSSADILIDGFRPPAVPLIVFDPYISIWSFQSTLTEDFTRHWSGTTKALVGILRIDGIAYRFMGPSSVGTNNAMQQTDLKVYPTNTQYSFTAAGVSLQLTFTTPALPDLESISKPFTYLSFEVQSTDNKQHDVQLYFDCTGEISVNNVNEQITWNHKTIATPPQSVMSMGTQSQEILKLSGDGVGINWGYAYISVLSSADQNVSTVITGSVSARTQFISKGSIPTTDDTRKPRACNDDWPVMTVAWNFGTVNNQAQSRYLTFLYDDILSIDYFGLQLPPYWRKDGHTAADMLNYANFDYQDILWTTQNFDEALLQDINEVGGQKYATLCALAYRQTTGACKLTWNPQRNIPWYFMKEISSDGDLSTVDVIFPASPFFLYVNPELLELLLLPIMAYGANETNVPYNLPWAPHHLGEYPIGNLPPNRQEQMPVEETGNMLMMLAALGAKNPSFLSMVVPKYRDLIRSWGQYLISGAGVLPDPGNQLCTDDFLGPSPHNVNLAVKGIVGIGCYAYICQLLGDINEAQKYQAIASNFSQYWISHASDGDHFRLQYDEPNTWSLKYNFMFQVINSLNTFPRAVIQKDIDYLVNNHWSKYGIPLLSKASFTKLDWLSWIAAASSDQNQFLKLIGSIYDFANETPSRVPLTDWYDVPSARQQGFQARSVVGGIYAKLLVPDPSKGHRAKINNVKGEYLTHSKRSMKKFFQH